MKQKNKFRIAMISEHGDPLAPLGGQQSGGQNVYVHELARALSKLGVSVDVYTRWDNRKSDPVVRFAERAKVIRLKAGPRQFVSKDKFGPLMPEFVEKFLEYTRTSKTKYDLIHSHYYFSGWAGLQLKNILKIPLVGTYHSLGLLKKKAMGERDTSPTERTAIERLVMEKANKIIATSPSEKLSMISEYKPKNANISVVPCGVNLLRFKPIDKNKSRKKLGIALNKKVIVFASKMERRKGGLTVVAVAREIKKRWPDLYENLQIFMFSGDPRKERVGEKQEENFRHVLIDEIKKSGVKDKIILGHGIDQEKLHDYYCAANVVLMPSYYEPFGMVAIEAMASGTPVVASNVGGLKWVVEDGITGFRAEPKAADKFAKQVAKILLDPALEKRLGENGIVKMRQNFSWNTVAEKALEIYKELIVQNQTTNKK